MKVYSYKKVFDDLNGLDYFHNPSVNHISLLTFNDDDISQLPHTVISYINSFNKFKQNGDCYAVILRLISSHKHDMHMDVELIMYNIYEYTLKRFNNYSPLLEWLICELYSNNGHLGQFVKEYNRLKLTNPDILKGIT